MIEKALILNVCVVTNTTFYLAVMYYVDGQGCKGSMPSLMSNEYIKGLCNIRYMPEIDAYVR